MKERSTSCLVHGAIDVKSWLAATPSVEEVRPARCPHCSAAGRPSGTPIGMVGHGTRRRQVRGPAGRGEAPTIREVSARRYRCRTCGGTATVIPGGLVPRRHYGATAIALACFLLGLRGLAPAEVRERTAPGLTHEDGWPALRRWLGAIHAGRLLSFVRPWPPDMALPQRAERVATTVMAFAPGAYATDEERLWAGIALAA